MCTFCIHFSSKCFLQNEYFINVNKVYNVMYTSMFEFVYILCDTFFLHQTNSVWRQNLSSSSGHLHFKTLSAEQYPEFKVCYKAYKIKSSFLNAKGWSRHYWWFTTFWMFVFWSGPLKDLPAKARTQQFSGVSSSRCSHTFRALFNHAKFVFHVLYVHLMLISAPCWLAKTDSPVNEGRGHCMRNSNSWDMTASSPSSSPCCHENALGEFACRLQSGTQSSLL